MHNKIEETYTSKFSMSDPSIVSSGSSNSQRYSDNPLGASDIGQFDIIDDLDYDDVDDGLIGNNSPYKITPKKKINSINYNS